VEHVLPRQDGSAERGPTQRVGRAFPVRHVQDGRRRGRLTTAAGEVGGAAGAVVERVARAPDDTRELVAHPPEARDPPVDLVDLRRHPDTQDLGG